MFKAEFIRNNIKISRSSSVGKLGVGAVAS